MTKSNFPLFDPLNPYVGDMPAGKKQGIRNASNYAGPQKTRITLPSKTVPDMSLSLRDLLDRHTRGGQVKTFNPVFTGESSRVPDGLELMSKVERAQLVKDTSDFIATTRGRMQSRKQAMDIAEREKLAAAKIAAKAAAAQTPSGEALGNP